MQRETDPPAVEPPAAPAERADAADLEAARRAFLEEGIAATLLEAIPDPAMVLTAQRQIVAANGHLRKMFGAPSFEDIFGLRPGEAIQCTHCADAAGGCGTGPFCLNCGAVAAITESLATRATVSRECRLQIVDGANGGALDMDVQATFVTVAGTDLLIVALRDVSAEKRRRVLERAFFHDVLNTAVALHALAQFVESEKIPAEIEHTWRKDLRRVSEQMLEEIVAQRQLLAAEQGELQPVPTTERVRPLVESVLSRFRPHHAAGRPSLVLAEAPEGTLETDPVLLRRVLSNLVKNALEAAPEGTVTVRARQEGEQLVFEVHNPGVMPLNVQQQVFQRSFSTKAGHGRGIGTYSIRLFTERYLGGRVTFDSRDPDGTTFRVTVPRAWAGQ